MQASKYEQQLRWRQETQEQSRLAKIAEERRLKEECTFTPTIYSQHVPAFEGTAKVLTKAAGDNHIKRQEKARLNKQKTEDRAHWQPSKKSKIVLTHNSMPAASSMLDQSEQSHSRQQSTDSLATNVHTRQNTCASPTDFGGSSSSAVPDLPAEFLRKSQNGHRGSPSSNGDFDEFTVGSQYPGGGNDLHSLEEFTLVKLIEQERKEWSEERCKLVNCLHLQQLELTQRASAAQQRAGEIAKEFARAIEEFETRLLSVETNVQKEILVIKNITENLRHDIISAIKDNNSNGGGSGTIHVATKSPDDKSANHN